MDGDTRGGAALSIKKMTGVPICFIGVGEKLPDIDLFHPDRMASRILGMGDVVSLVEKAQEQYDEKQARELKKKIARNQFTINEFYEQLKQVQKMGNLKDLAGMLPGMDKALKDVDIPDDAFKPTEAIIQSMTPFEREHPDAINSSRRRRIALGSGTTVADVNKLMKQFEQTRKMMKMAVDGSLQQRLKAFRR
jgi:signal recognition particle subunit SRP54